MTEIEIFLTDCQRKAENGIARLEAEMLSSFSASVADPSEPDELKDITFDLPNIPLALPDSLDDATEMQDPDASRVLHDSYVWTGNYMQMVQRAISSALNSGGIGISDRLQDAIFGKDRERRKQALSDALDMANAGLGARGFSLPTDYLLATRSELLQKYQWDDTELSRQITTLMEEHARQNWQFCIQNGISAEQFHANFTTAYDKLFNDATHTALEKYKTTLEHELNKFKTEIENINTALNGYKTRADIMKSEKDVAISLLKTRLEKNVASTNANVHAAGVNAQKETAAYKAYADAVKSYAQTATGGLLKIIDE